MKLQRGVNFGGWLSQCVHTKEHYDSFIRPEDFERAAKMGFDHIRLPVDSNVLEDAEGRVSESGYGYIDMAVSECGKNGLSLIIDLHKAYGYDFNDAGDAEKNSLFKDPYLKDRFVGLWERIAARCGKYSGFVAFELLNEVVEASNNDLWNDLVDRTVTAIRAIAPDSTIIYGGICWNSATTLKLLRRPVTDNVIYTFHFYEPLLFTHQKATWVPALDNGKSHPYPATMEYFRTESEALGYQGGAVLNCAAKTMGPEFITEMVSDAVSAAKKAGVGLYCGEFGVIDQAPIEDTLRWFEDVDGVFRRFGIGCAVWNYKLMDFGLTDSHYAPILERILALWNK